MAAYLRAGGKAKEPNKAMSEILAIPECKKYHDELLQKQQDRTNITADKVLEKWWSIVNADMNEISQHRLECCRYCYGVDHAFHWIDEDEHARAQERANNKAEDGNGLVEIVDDSGGFGFDPNLSPHAKCPQCHGNGVARVHVNDTRHLQGAARLLYDGVEITKTGLKIKTLSRDKALENVARHLGMFKDNLSLDIPEDSPLASLINNMSGNTLKPPSGNN